MLLQNGHLARRMATWTTWSAPQGLIYRYPLTDIRMLRFTLVLPPDLLWQNGMARCLFRSALRGLLPRHPGKRDVANEEKRMNIRAECWQLIADEAENGELQQHCAWLDTQALHALALEVPKHMTFQNLLDFIPLYSSLQVWHLWHRYLAGDSQPQPLRQVIMANRELSEIHGLSFLDTGEKPIHSVNEGSVNLAILQGGFPRWIINCLPKMTKTHG